MRHLFTAILTFLLLPALGQQGTWVPSHTLGAAPAEHTRTDSFVLVSRTYALARDCDRQDQSNCCSFSYSDNQGSLGCYNGTALSWDYLPNAAIAARNVEHLALQTSQQVKTFKKEPVTCYLLGKEFKGYALTCAKKEDQVWYNILVSGEVDGQALVVQFHSPYKITRNEQLQPLYRQVFSLKL